MHEFNQKMIRVIMIAAAASIVLTLLGGITLLKNNYYLKAKFWTMQVDYLREKIAFEKYNGHGYADWLASTFKSEAMQAATPGPARSVPVLLYHGVMTDPTWQSDGTNISLTDFRRQMFALKKAGYECVTLRQFLDFMQNGKPLPAKSVLLTFDDGRSDSFYPVDPILRVLNYQAVMFTITGRSISNPDYKNTFHLSKIELEKMQQSGRWELASHTQNGHGFVKIDANGSQGHFLSDKQWLDQQNRLETEAEFTARVTADLANSKKDLENSLPSPVLGFAYPFGDYGVESQNFPPAKDILAKAANALFPLSFRQTDENEYPNNYPGKNFQLVKRIDSNSNLSVDKLLFLLASGEEKTLPYSDQFLSNRGWLTAWGNSELKNGLLLTRASTNEDSSMTFLDGTFSWTDYRASARAKLLQGNSFALVSRFTNGNNYVSCDFSDTGVALSQMLGGRESLVSSADYRAQLTNPDGLEVGVGISGNTATCYIGNTPVAAGTIAATLGHGGVGFKTWDENLNNSSLLVSTLQVDPFK